MTSTARPVHVRRPVVARNQAELADALAQVRRHGGRVGLVPTMGALHEGHATLARTARARQCEAVVVSIFVNPLQFGPAEDLARYPRTWEADLEVCAVEGVDVVFAPGEETVYPGGPPLVSVDPGPLGLRFEGSSRPTHFRGVLTVVAKLLGLVRPDLAVFGEKDYQQLVLVRRMVEDLCLGVEVVAVQTVRAADGLAVSSRNRYLQGEERSLALGLSRALRAGVEAGPHGADRVLSSAIDTLRAPSGAGLLLDYLDLVAPDLGAAPRHGEARLLLAARVGTTRLIDNAAVTLGRLNR